MKPAVVLNKSTKVHDATTVCASVCLSVASATGVPVDLFVHKYNPTTGAYSFQHTAYYDELTSVPDTVKNSKTACTVRLASASYSAASLDKINEWVDGVCSDIRRLLLQYQFFNETTISDVDVICIDVNGINDTVVGTDSDEDTLTIGGIDIEI